MSLTHQRTPHYTKNEEADRHFKLLREQVNSVLKMLPSSRLTFLQVKAIILPALYFLIYTIAIFQTSYFLFCIAYILLGFMLVIIFLNLIHEASHNTLFRGKKKNQRYMLVFDLIGANSYMWNKRHVVLHHNYNKFHYN